MFKSSSTSNSQTFLGQIKKANVEGEINHQTETSQVEGTNLQKK